MELITAYIRPALSHRVIEALKHSGATNISILHAKGLGLLEDPNDERYDAEFIEKSSAMMRLEIITDGESAERYVRVIQQFAHTGKAGDGIVYVSDVWRTVKISTGEEGVV
ncbi:MAG: P-II family nitrogen regulator [Bacteroidota bacterium]